MVESSHSVQPVAATTRKRTAMRAVRIGNAIRILGLWPKQLEVFVTVEKKWIPACV